MKKLNKVASIFATAALAVASSGAFAQAKTIDNWVNPNGLVWKNGTNELCWRDAFWTPATAAAGCDGALKPAAAGSRCPRRLRRPPGSGARAGTGPGAGPDATGRRCADQREGHLRRRRILRLRQVGAEARRPCQARRSGQQDVGHQPRGHHRRRPHRLRSAATPTTSGCRSVVPKPSRPIWSARVSRRTASTPKARARSSRSPTTGPPKAARRIAASKSKWSARATAEAKFSFSTELGTPLRRGFLLAGPACLECRCHSVSSLRTPSSALHRRRATLPVSRIPDATSTGGTG